MVNLSGPVIICTDFTLYVIGMMVGTWNHLPNSLISAIVNNVGIKMINHPLVITIDSWYNPFPVLGGLWHCYTHIGLEIQPDFLLPCLASHGSQFCAGLVQTQLRRERGDTACHTNVALKSLDGTALQ